MKKEFLKSVEIAAVMLAKAYIGLSLNKNIDEEEQYYNNKIKEYNAFIEGYKSAIEINYDKIITLS